MVIELRRGAGDTRPRHSCARVLGQRLGLARGRRGGRRPRRRRARACRSATCAHKTARSASSCPLVNAPRRVADGPVRTALALLVDHDHRRRPRSADPRIARARRARAASTAPPSSVVVRTAPALPRRRRRAALRHALPACIPWSRSPGRDVWRRDPCWPPTTAGCPGRVNFSVRGGGPDADLRALLRGSPCRDVGQAISATGTRAPRAARSAPAEFERAARGRSARVRLGFAVKVLGDGGLPTSDNRRWQSGPAPALLAGDARTASSTTASSHDLRMYRFAASHRALRDPSRPAAVPRPGRRVPRGAGGLRRARARARHPPLHAPEPVHRPQLREPGDDGRRRSATSRSRPRCWTPWAWTPRRSASCTSAARPAGARRRSSASSAASSSSRTRARARLVIENDDRTFSLRTRSRSTAAPACASCGTSCTTTASTPRASRTREALDARARPPGRRTSTPKIHWSTPRTAMEERKKKVGRRVERSWVLPPAARPRRHGRPDRLRALPARRRPRACATST